MDVAALISIPVLGGFIAVGVVRLIDRATLRSLPAQPAYRPSTDRAAVVAPGFRWLPINYAARGLPALAGSGIAASPLVC